MITLKAFAKINLTLCVGEKRPDGYHEVETIMHRISLHDKIQLTRAPDISLNVMKGSISSDSDNLMWRAAELFLKKMNISGGVHMTLHKEIPTGAGLGGGSADAAAVIYGLHQLYEIPFSLSYWSEQSAVLGADVPFSFLSGAALCTGIGEKVSPLTPSLSLPLIIIKPPLSISTIDAYKILDEYNSTERKNIQEKSTDKMIQHINQNIPIPTSYFHNDFEKPLCHLYPELQEIKSYGEKIGIPAQMTGSGAAFFFVCQNKENQLFLFEKIKKDHPHWFLAQATTI